MDIRARILARPDLADLRAARDLDKLAAALNAEGLLERRSRIVTARVVRTLPDGKAILAALKGARSADDDIDLAYTFLMQGAGLDIAECFDLIDGLVASEIFLQAWAEQIKGLAMFPVTVERLEVEAALDEIRASEST